MSVRRTPKAGVARSNRVGRAIFTNKTSNLQQVRWFYFA
jgi:hypothetical protein